MTASLLKSISTSKYERLLPRFFPGANGFALNDLHGSAIWEMFPAVENTKEVSDTNGTSTIEWKQFSRTLQRRDLAEGRLQFRSAIHSRELGSLGWLVVQFDARLSVPMSTAPSQLGRAFADAVAFYHEDIELQSECNQLAIELSERYEELNLVYATKDQVEFFEEGQEALSRLVHNCTDYLNVGFSALICRDRNLSYYSATSGMPHVGNEELLGILGTTVYDRVEAQVESIIINDPDDVERQRVFGGHKENLLAYPIFDEHATVIGIISVVASENSHVFSNGDRNLLEVMAKKASRIIHTHHDSLTGLMNRSGFEPSLVAALATAHSKGLQHCLLHIDMDQLRVINDLLGYQEGDVLIRRVAKVLRSELRDTDTLARLGGDEFAVLLPNCTPAQAEGVAEKVRTAMHQLQVISANRQLDVTVSSGIASIDKSVEGIVGVMAAAEIACKAAKEAGRDRVQVFEHDDTSLQRRSEEIEWVGRVQQALRDDQFVLYCQPVLPMKQPEKAPHFEILLRLLGDDGEIVAPGLFLPAAERYQLMPQIDRWVIRAALQALCAVWSDIVHSDAVFCINLSGQSLTNPGFQTFVTDEIDRAALPADKICFEITETAAISNIDEALDFMAAMKRLGCRFSLDDFGAGLSSFGYLKMLPVDYLKIDGSFVREMTNDRVSRSMVEAICKIGKTMGLATVAEYVGDDATIELLGQIGVDYMQGFHVGEPVKIDRIFDGLRGSASAAQA